MESVGEKVTEISGMLLFAPWPGLLFLHVRSKHFSGPVKVSRRENLF
jgi:hypothetical protein